MFITVVDASKTFDRLNHSKLPFLNIFCSSLKLQYTMQRPCDHYGAIQKYLAVSVYDHFKCLMQSRAVDFLV
jgi:hypothetical protein